MTATLTRAVKVCAIRAEAQDVLSLDFVALDGLAMAPQAPGAHLDLHLPNGLVRSYSLCGGVPGQVDNGHYRIAVGRSANSRGASAYVHEHVRVGDTLRIGAARNHFSLDPNAQKVVLVAGGIGITPLLPMARQCAQEGRDWHLHYCIRSAASAAFIEELKDLEAGHPRVSIWCPGIGGNRFDAARMLSPPLPRDTHVYCCGSPSLMHAVEQAIGWLPEQQRHFERFQVSAGTSSVAREAKAFTLYLERSRQMLQVPADQSVLECLEAAGVAVPFACREGLCGSCETAVLEGCIEHLDFVLSAAERVAHKKMMVCVSRAAGQHLRLDI